MACLFVVITLAILALWCHSYFNYAYLNGVFASGNGMIASSKHGHLSWTWHKVENQSRWKFRLLPAKEYRQFMDQMRRSRGVISSPEPGLFDFKFGEIRWSRGWRASFPHWLPALTAGGLAALMKPAPRSRVSVREVFTILTMASVLLGIVAAIVNSLTLVP
jgi:hypothetical protein